jgi:hypothetical protein
MTKTNTASCEPKNPSNKSSSNADLDSRYGAIGISAVAAALQFKSKAKNPADAPAAPQPRDERLSDMAA